MRTNPREFAVDAQTQLPRHAPYSIIILPEIVSAEPVNCCPAPTYHQPNWKSALAGAHTPDDFFAT